MRISAALPPLAALALSACERSGASATPAEGAPGDSSVETTAMLLSGGEANEQPKIASARAVGGLEVVATIEPQMPTGITVSPSGRIFLSFPRWGDPVAYTVAELVDRKLVPYPDGTANAFPGADPSKSLVSVQSVVADATNRLWALDTGSVKHEPSAPGAAKLVAIDLVTNKIVKTITFPTTTVPLTSYLTDVRFDLRRGKAGVAFITDSAAEGPNGIVVVNLDSGRSWRHLANDKSVKADPGFLAFVEGQPLVEDGAPDKPAKPLAMGSDGIALSGDGKTLYYCPLGSRHLYDVSADALANESMPEVQVAASVKDLGEKGASDGLELDARGRLYATQYETNAIVRRKPDGAYETVVADPRILWPDTMAVAPDGYLYFTANQLERQPQYNHGHDLRQKPYVVFRVNVGAGPALQN